MISITIPSVKPEKKSILEEKEKREILRRDSIIAKLWRECPYFKGDIVEPALADRKGEGEYLVDQIDKDWKEYACGRPFKSVDWPENDNPYLVSATSKKTGKNIIATVNYFERVKK